jgi:alpha-amylase/alpha-mannosidase (GH57 family)
VRFICIHGHFYQPPRENPWTGEIELQPSAAPFHDWNQRVSAESYLPNTRVLIPDPGGRVVRLLNNYSHISYNFGPTLLAWLEQAEPETYQAIIRSDIEARPRFSGHGPAIAQCYNHIIMPLANSRDKRTQVIWGLRDFEHRFQRKPEGMWLPETAVDIETLDIMAELGIRFTILAPHQVRLAPTAYRLPPTAVDSHLPYSVRLPSGRGIAVFIYDAGIAGDIAFGDLLKDADRLYQRLMTAFSADDRNQLVSVATDGETYGHHHPGGDGALAWCLRRIEADALAKLTVYGEYLEQHAPTQEAQVIQGTSWSCAHGVERWRSDCGDNSGSHPDWNQKWRAPLREALDWLRDRLSGFYETRMKQLVTDPWLCRDDYIDIILDPGPVGAASQPREERIREFIIRHARTELRGDQRAQVVKLLQLQKLAMLMFTSDAWFFDDISGLEPVQNLSYAAQAIQLAQELGSESLESGFLDILARTESNIPAQGTGADIYRRLLQSRIPR